jgi:hypothetical protein
MAQLLKQANACVPCDDCLGQHLRAIVDDNNLEQPAVERLRTEAAKARLQGVRLVKVRDYDCCISLADILRANSVGRATPILDRGSSGFFIFQHAISHRTTGKS